MNSLAFPTLACTEAKQAPLAKKGPLGRDTGSTLVGVGPVYQSYR